jgi:serine/threonine protein kinase
MISSVAQLDQFRAQSQYQTPLRQMCGSPELFHDRYQILRVVGRGGFGVTFLARDVRLPGMPLCVIKQLCPKVDTPSMVHRAAKRFEREAKILGQLGSHAQIPQLLNYFEQDQGFFLVQEYIKGCTLAKEVKRNGLFSEYQVKQFLREILPVLSYVHAHGVIHRDIKPPNILRSQEDGRLVLIDFGAVKEQFFDAEIAMPRATTTHFVGTLGFAPPEQLALRTAYSSDLFALGVTCLYLLTGKPPMAFETDEQTGEVRWQPYVSFISDSFAQVLEQMLRMTLCDRFQSANEILDALAEATTPDLSDCLNTVRSQVRFQGRSQPPEIDANYLTPTQRKAVDIRRWRARLAARDQT